MEYSNHSYLAARAAIQRHLRVVKRPQSQHFHRRSIQRSERSPERPPRAKGEKRSSKSGLQKRFFSNCMPSITTWQKLAVYFEDALSPAPKTLVSDIDAVLLVYNHDSIFLAFDKSCKALSRRPIYRTEAGRYVYSNSPVRGLPDQEFWRWYRKPRVRKRWENNGPEASCQDHDSLGEGEPRFWPTSSESTQASILAIDSGSQKCPLAIIYSGKWGLVSARTNFTQQQLRSTARWPSPSPGQDSQLQRRFAKEAEEAALAVLEEENC